MEGCTEIGGHAIWRDDRGLYRSLEFHERIISRWNYAVAKERGYGTSVIASGETTKQSRVLLEIFDGLAPEAVIPAKAGIQVFFLGPRFRGDDNQGSPPSGNP